MEEGDGKVVMKAVAVATNVPYNLYIPAAMKAVAAAVAEAVAVKVK